MAKSGIPKVVNEVSDYDYTNVAVALQKGMSLLQQEDTCTDFEILVGRKSFRCHKVVLASVSDFFKAMFNSGMKETVQGQTTFSDVKPEAVEIILNLLYPKEDIPNPLANIDDDIMSELLRLSERWQMPFLKELCIQYFTVSMSTTNSIERWNIGKVTLCEDLEHLAWNFMLSHFDELAGNEMLHSLDFEDFQTIVKSEFLQVSKEDTVWQTVNSWIQFNSDDRSECFPDLARHCCWTEIDPDSLIEEIAFDPAVRKNDEISMMVKDAIKYRRHPALHGHLELNYRESMGKEQVTILLGKRTSPEKGTTKDTIKTLCFSRRQNSWIWLRPLHGVGEGFACCVHGGSIFVTGGSDSKGSATYEYSGADDNWMKKRPMIVPLKAHTMVAMDTCLYVIGGRSAHEINGQIQEYCCETDFWRLDGEIVAPVENASSAVVGRKIFIFGGNLDDDVPADSVQVYDTETKTATIFCHLPSPCNFSRAIVRDDVMHIVTSVGEVVELSSNVNKTKIISTLPAFKRKNFGIGMTNGMLHVYGGVDVYIKAMDTCKMTSEILALELTSGNKEDDAHLPFPFEVFGSANLVVGKLPVQKPAAK